MLDKIIERHQLSNRFENHQDLEITTDLDLSGSGVVTVSLRGPYRGWLLLKGFDIATLDKGPYLYR
jgi:hypothetical protein